MDGWIIKCADTCLHVARLRLLAALALPPQPLLRLLARNFEITLHVLSFRAHAPRVSHAPAPPVTLLRG
jgi:hypothetical protein